MLEDFPRYPNTQIVRHGPDVCERLWEIGHQPSTDFPDETTDEAPKIDSDENKRCCAASPFASQTETRFNIFEKPNLSTCGAGRYSKAVWKGTNYRYPRAQQQ